MGLFWKKYTIIFPLETKDDKIFRHVYVDFEQKRNLYWLTSSNIILHKSIKHCIQEIFLTKVNQSWIFEGEDINRLIDEEKLDLVNYIINTFWKEYWETKCCKIRNIKITHLIR